MNLLRHLFLTSAILLTSLQQAQARFGETLEEITARYGTPIAVINKKYCEASDGGSYLFNARVKNLSGDGSGITRVIDFRIQVEFKDNRAWMIRYNVKNMVPADRTDLMSLNLGNVIWSEAITVKGLSRIFWKDIKTNSRFATFYKSKTMNVLQIASAECTKALSQQRNQESSYIADMQDWAPLVERGQGEPSATGAPVGPVPASSQPDAVRLPGL
jgi:hypothetical protein